MKPVLTFLFLSIMTLSMYEQKREVILQVDQGKTLFDQLSSIPNKESLTRLRIIVPENLDGYVAFGMINYQYDYENINVSFDYQVSEIPDIIEEFSGLQNLNVSHLGLSTLPANLDKLGSLEYLDLSFNLLNISKEIEKLRAIKSLKTIKLYGNPLSPNDITLLQSLELEDGFYYELEDLQKEDNSENLKYGKPNKVNALKQRLYEEAQRYYSFDSLENEDFPGYQVLIRILEDKINAHLDEQNLTTWKRLVAEYKDLDPVCETILDIGYSQFPAYELLVITSDKTKNKIRERKSMGLNISLLTNHYTIYFETTLFFDNYKNTFGQPSTKRIFYGTNAANDEEKQMLLTLQNLMEKHFPNHSYIPYHILFIGKFAGAVPHGEFPDRREEGFSIFRFLFGNIHIGDADILE